MKKLLSLIIIVFVLVGISVFTVNAEENTSNSNNMIFDLSEVYNSLSEEVRQSLDNIGINGADSGQLSSLSFDAIIKEIVSLTSDNISSPLRGLLNITALLLLCSIISTYKSSLNSDISTVLNIASALCITCAVSMPAITVINLTSSVITISSNIMIAYIPVMTVIMASSGHPVSGASYYSMMIAAGEGVGQISSKIIAPLLNMFLGLSITSSVSPDINLGGFMTIISKSVKWLLGFTMTIFTAVLSFRQLITTSLDNLSTRAVRFTLSSFIPVVGSALSDAYKTVQGSVGLLKSGLGIFVIIAVAFAFLPVIIQCLLWIITLWIGRSTAEVLNLTQAQKLLDSITGVFSILIAILLCIMSVYIISTAIVLMIGGGGA